MAASQIRAKAHIGSAEKKQSDAEGEENNVEHSNFLGAVMSPRMLRAT
jgi:hypothetical protein